MDAMSRKQLVTRLRRLLEAAEHTPDSRDANWELARELQTTEGWWTSIVEEDEISHQSVMPIRCVLSIMAD